MTSHLFWCSLPSLSIRAARVLLLLALAAGGTIAQAQEHAVTLYGGYRDGGRFTDAASGNTLRVDGAKALAISLDMPLDANRQLQLFLSRQSSDLGIEQAALTPLGSKLPLTVTYLHIGGNYFFEGPVGKGPYVVGGLGVTFFEPSGDGFGNELRPSLNLGFGYQFLLGARLALRLEARGYGTWVNSSGGFFCSGGCVVSVKGESVTQGEALLGLSFRF